MKYIYILFLFLIGIQLEAQDYNIKRLGLEDGLSNNYIMSITQDRKGFMWYATESGLNRFDGNNFRLYKKNNSKEMSKVITGNELNMVYADKYEDAIWIATQREGLNRFDCESERFVAYKHDANNPTSIITNDVTSVANSRDGNLWISTYHKGFEYFDKKTEEFTHYNKSTIPGLVSNNVWSITESKSGLVYIGHVYSGFSIYSPTDNTIKNYQHESGNQHSLPGNSVNVVFVDHNENVWLGTDAGLALFNPIAENFTVFKHQPNVKNSLVGNFIHSISQFEDGKLWIGAENGGVSVLDIQQSMFSTAQNIKFSNIRSGDDVYSLSNQTVRDIFQDSYGNIWIGTYGGGINFISNRQPFFRNWTYSPIPSVKNSLSNKIAWGIVADSSNRLWIGTDGGGIDIFENGNKIKTYSQQNSKLSDNAVIAAFRDSRGSLWFGTFAGGVNIYNTQTGQFTKLKLENDQDVRCFSEDSKGDIWIGCSNGIYVYSHNEGKIRSYNKENTELRDNLVRAIYHDAQDNVWIGFFGEGVTVYDSEMKKINHFDVSKGLPSNLINHISADKKGNIWIATGDGLAYFSGGASIPPIIYNVNDGMSDSHVRAVVEDAQGNIWMSTTSGISRFEVQNKQFYNYNHFNGVPLGDFMSGSVAITAGNTIYFGSQNGVCFFSPSSIPAIANLPAIVITNFKIYDNKVDLSENEKTLPITPIIQLEHDKNTFEVSFNILDYSLEHIIEYSYMLKGLEEHWYTSQNDKSVTFRNLPHGSYQFLIRSRVKNQDWTDDITTLDINIAPPLWLTWWAKSIYILLIASFIIGVARFYKRKLSLENSLILEKKNHMQEQEINNERLRFFTNITHELRTPLTLILGPLEDLSVDKTLSEKHASKIRVIHKSATRLLNLINQILEFRKTETQNKRLSVKKSKLDVQIREIGLKYKELNTKDEVVFDTIVEDGDYLIYYDTDMVSTILENLISNSYKYTDKGSVSLTLRSIVEKDTTYIEIEVKDTGRGIHPQSINKIFDRYYQEQGSFQSSGTGIGLALVHRLVLLHEGTIAVDSKMGKGTSFYIRLDANNKYLDAIHSDDDLDVEVVETVSEVEIYEAKETKQIILVIEDNEEINNYIVDSLSVLYTVYFANDGKEGLEKAYKYIPDIIISDIMMPLMDGFELTKILKEDIRTSHIPIILLTAKDTIQDRTEGYSVGADSYITKPFSASLLKSRILNILDSRRKLAQVLQNNDGDKSTLMIESLNNLDKEFIEKVQQIIEDNLNSDTLDVNFIANQLFMSHSTLYRKIKALTELTANEFIRKIRMLKAEELLLTGKFTISEISYMVGINSISYFRQNFKDEFGLVPSEYIKKLKKEE